MISPLPGHSTGILFLCAVPAPPDLFTSPLPNALLDALAWGEDRFDAVSRASEAEPLAQQGYNRVVQWLKSHKLRPADLLVPEHVPVLAKDTGISESRLTALLKRGVNSPWCAPG